MGYVAWTDKVAALVTARLGSEALELDDFNYLGMYLDNLTPEEACEMVAEDVLFHYYSGASA